MLGTGAPFTRAVADGLLESGLRPFACIQSGSAGTPLATLPGTSLEIPAPSPWLARMQRAGSLVMFEGDVPDPAGWIRNQAIDLLLVACWPRRIPPAVYRAPRIAALNLHPSLLPDWPGRDPVGDMLRAGDSHYGVTLHRLEEVLDGGEILSQRAFAMPPGSDRTTIEERAARLGAALVAAFIHSRA